MATSTSEHATRPPAPIRAPRGIPGAQMPVAAAGAALAALAGAALAAGRWPLVVLAVAAAAWGALALRDGPATATLVVLTLGLPAYAVPWFGDLAPGVGLLTVLVAALLAAIVVPAPRAALAAALRLARQPAVWALAAFFAVAAASLVLAPRSGTSLGLVKGYAGQAVALPVLMAAALVAAGAAGAERIARRLGSVAIGLGAAGGLLAIAQAIAEGAFLAPRGYHSRVIEAFVGERAIAFAEHPGTWAAFALLPLGIGCARWLRAPGPWLGAAVALTAAGTVLTLARAGWIGLVVVALVAVVVTGGVPARRRAALLALVAVASGLAFGLARVADFPSTWPVTVRLPDPRIAYEREAGGGPGSGAGGLQPGGGGLGIADRLGVDRSVTMRLILSRAELEIGARRPLTGVGLGGIGPAMPALRPRAVYGRSGDLGFVPGEPIDKHNTYAGLFAELGVPGILAFLAVLATLALTLERARRAARDRPELAALAAGLLAALAATAAYATFSDADRLPFLWWVGGMAIGLGALARDARSDGAA